MCPYDPAMFPHQSDLSKALTAFIEATQNAKSQQQIISTSQQDVITSQDEEANDILRSTMQLQSEEKQASQAPEQLETAKANLRQSIETSINMAGIPEQDIINKHSPSQDEENLYNNKTNAITEAVDAALHGTTFQSIDGAALQYICNALSELRPQSSIGNKKAETVSLKNEMQYTAYTRVIDLTIHGYLQNASQQALDTEGHDEWHTAKTAAVEALRSEYQKEWETLKQLPQSLDKIDQRIEQLKKLDQQFKESDPEFMSKQQYIDEYLEENGYKLKSTTPEKIIAMHKKRTKKEIADTYDYSVATISDIGTASQMYALMYSGYIKAKNKLGFVKSETIDISHKDMIKNAGFNDWAEVKQNVNSAITLMQQTKMGRFTTKKELDALRLVLLIDETRIYTKDYLTQNVIDKATKKVESNPFYVLANIDQAVNEYQTSTENLPEGTDTQQRKGQYIARIESILSALIRAPKALVESAGRGLKRKREPEAGAGQKQEPPTP